MVTLPLSASIVSIPNPQAIHCKFLFSREQFRFCHIQFPDSIEKVPAISHEGSYYSIFKSVESVQSALELAIKLGNRGNELAITQTRLRYILWVQEPHATVISSQAVASSQGEQIREAQPTFKSGTCLLFPENQPYKFIYLTVPDLTHRTPGFQHDLLCYSLLYREKDAAKAFSAVAELASRGLELALVPLPTNYAICVFEPNARPAAST